MTSFLWPEGRPSARSVWAIADAAADPRLSAAIAGLSDANTCLWDSSPSRHIPNFAPHLIALEDTDALTALLLGEGWGRGWAVFLRSAAPREELRAHCVSLLAANDGSGDALFRYYDPRVLRAFLPLATSDQVDRFFRAATHYAMEDPPGAGFVEFRLERGAAKALHWTPGAPVPQRSEGEARRPPAVGSPLLLSSAQRRAIEQAVLQPALDRVLARLEAGFPQAMSTLNREARVSFVREGSATARRFGILEEPALTGFLALALTISPDFHAHPAIRTILTTGGWSPREKLERLIAQVRPAQWGQARGSIA